MTKPWGNHRKSIPPKFRIPKMMGLGTCCSLQTLLFWVISIYVKKSHQYVAAILVSNDQMFTIRVGSLDLRIDASVFVEAAAMTFTQNGGCIETNTCLQ